MQYLYISYLMNEISDINWASMSDNVILETLGAFIKHHRLNQNKSQTELARAAGISRSTLSLLERGEKTSINSFVQVLRILDQLHVMEVFRVENEISPIEYARLQKKKRQRAGNKKEDPNSKNEKAWLM